jgi:hypothetical protein
MDLLRKVFQKAVVVPMDGVEEVWKEYDKFENSLSKLTVRLISSSGDEAVLWTASRIL